MQPILSYLDGNYPVYFYTEQFSHLFPKVSKEVHLSIEGNGNCQDVLCSDCPCAHGSSCCTGEILLVINRLIPNAIDQYPELFI